MVKINMELTVKVSFISNICDVYFSGFCYLVAHRGNLEKNYYQSLSKC